jgi:maleate isomerase
MSAPLETSPEIRVYPRRPPLDARPLAKRIGLIILATDHTTEPDFRRMVASDRIGVYVARIAYANPTTPGNLRKMQPSLSEGARLILPDETLDAICYSCTAASAVIGDEEVAKAINKGKPGVPVVTPPLAAIRGLKALGAKRISVLTPYTIETTRPLIAYFVANGFELASSTCLGFADDREMARIAPASLVELARETTAKDADALFISCTALRAASMILEAEAATGRPVISSNQATAWNCMRLCGEAAARPEFGRLMTMKLSD